MASDTLTLVRFCSQNGGAYCRGTYTALQGIIQDEEGIRVEIAPCLGHCTDLCPSQPFAVVYQFDKSKGLDIQTVSAEHDGQLYHKLCEKLHLLDDSS